MKKNALTLTVVANMTSNYSEGLGNIASVQKVFKNRKVYTIRSRESLKNAVMVQAGMYDDLQTEVDGATQKLVTPELNAATCRALEGGYMSTKGITYVRKSSVYFTCGSLHYQLVSSKPVSLLKYYALWRSLSGRPYL